MPDDDTPAWMMRLIVGDEIQAAVNRIAELRQIDVDGPRYAEVPTLIAAAQAEIAALRAQLPPAPPAAAAIAAGPSRAAGIRVTIRRIRPAEAEG